MTISTAKGDSNMPKGGFVRMVAVRKLSVSLGSQCGHHGEFLYSDLGRLTKFNAPRHGNRVHHVLRRTRPAFVCQAAENSSRYRYAVAYTSGGVWCYRQASPRVTTVRNPQGGMVDVMIYVELVGMLLVILLAAEIFTNALEHLGEKLKISEGVTGSLFAAVGTAMPESMVPILAIFAGTEHVDVNEEIGVGAIIGAPLMLSTLSLCLMGLSVVGQRGFKGGLTPEKTGLERDLNFFLLAFGIAAGALFIPREPQYFVTLKVVLGITLVLVYFVYVMLTLRVSAQLVMDGHGTQAHTDMYLCRLGLPDHMLVLLIQIAIGLGLLVAGAEGFIHNVDEVAREIGVSALLLSL